MALPTDPQSLLQSARSIEDWVVQLRRQIHRNPELMYEEEKTSALVQKTLTDLGIEFRAGMAETGVLAELGSGDGPCVALRADMDALPIHEEADVDFASEMPGKMHACGHDCHTAMLLGAARLLKERESEIPGRVKLLFQPAEEGGAGGMRMRDEGALKAPDVQRIFALHMWPEVEVGSIASRSGVFLAAATHIRIRVHGVGGHAAMPHLNVDPVTTAAQIITGLQSIVSRETDPLGAGVVSITAIEGGDAYNVIPAMVELRGTARALSMDELKRLQRRVGEVATHIAEAHGCRAESEFPGNHYPPTFNDAECWQMAQGVGADLLGAASVLEAPTIMGGEDFAFYTEEIPGCFVALGTRNEAKGCTFNVHHPRFKVDEDALSLGCALHVGFALQSLQELRG